MKYFELTIQKWSYVSSIVLVLFISVCPQAYSQTNNSCSLACNGHLNVTMDENCEALITADEVLNGQMTSCPNYDINTFLVTVSNQYGSIPNPVPSDYVGQDLYVQVQEPITGNSCWGTITIKDELGPQVDGGCPDANTVLEISCFELGVYEGPVFVDACEGIKETVLVTENIDPYDCHDDYIKYVELTYTAYDSNNTRGQDCTFRFNVLRIDTNAIVCPPDYTEYPLFDGCDNNLGTLSCDGYWKPGQDRGIPDTDTDGDGELDADLMWDDDGDEYPDPEEIGVPSIVIGAMESLDLYPYPDIYCNAAIYYSDIEYPVIDCKKKVTRLWTINEWHCNDNVPFTIKQVIEINDDEKPEIVCDELVRVTTNAITGATNSSYGSVNCAASISLDLPSASDNCSSEFRYDISYPGFSLSYYDGQQSVLLPMGETEVTFKVWDMCYNYQTCVTTVVVEDRTPPVAVCDQYTAVSLTTGGEAVVNATSFDDGSYDDCKLHCMLVKRMPVNDDNYQACDCRIPSFCGLDYIGEYNGSYYYLSDYNVNADIAKQRAFAYEGSLAVFETEAEEDWLIDELRESYGGSFWIGMKRLGSTYLWDDHQALSYSNWVDYGPSGYDCVLMNSYNEWEDVSCLYENKYVLEIKDICGFSQTATFCCSDLDQDDLMVTFRVVDIFGNFNDCMVSVDVQNKVGPTLTCPDDQTINCDAPFDLQDLALIYGEAELSMECSTPMNIEETYIDDMTECNMGTFTRIFTVFEGEEDESTCKQVLTFVNPYPTTNPDNVQCPEDVLIVDCMTPEDFSPDIYGYPEFVAEPCGLIGTDWEDEVYTFNSSNTGPTCFKILRNWEIIDWCQPHLPVNSCVQVIKVTNGDRPVISGVSDLEECITDSDCYEGYIELNVSAFDECDSTNLSWRYEVFAGALGEGPKSYSQPVAYGSGNGPEADASGTYPIGSHVVRWTFFDRCGNATTSDQSFTIYNCKAPTAYCYNGLAVNLMPVDSSASAPGNDLAMVELWASDFDAGSFHPCGYEVTLSFSDSLYVPNIVFDCADISQDSIQEVRVYASVTAYNGSIYQSSCIATIHIQDNNNACEGSKDVPVTVGGNIFTEDLENMGDVEVRLEGSELVGMTNMDGSYAFPDMPTGGDYIIKPYSNNDPMNGVSTLDIIEIQRHVLGLEPITSPYKLIAADINRDFRISAQDLLELRKLILGIYDEFPNNTSWRFIDNGYDFLDPLNPFYEDFKEDYLISKLSEDMYVDFVAVKVGDVNDNAHGTSRIANERELTAGVTELQLDEKDFTAGEFIYIPVKVNRDDIRGMQFTLEINNDAIDIQSIESSLNGFNASNYRISGNIVAISWNTAERLTDRELFTIHAIANTDGKMSEVFNLGSSLVNAEVYDLDGNISKPVISSSNDASSAFKLYQNTPNPFTNDTEVRFSLENSGNVKITVSDVQGRVVHNVQQVYAKGMQVYNINANELNGAGVYYLTVSTPDHSATIKMVVIR